MNNLNSFEEIKRINMVEYNYDLPQNRIAMHPMETRHASKLLTYMQGEITEDIYQNIASQLPTNAHLVFNNTKVIAARMIFKKATGGLVEIFLLEPTEGTSHFEALHQKNTSSWNCMVGGVKKWKNNEIIKCPIQFSKEIILNAVLISKKEEFCTVKFYWDHESVQFSEIIAAAGKIPLPPYIKRETTENDEKRYQTIYAKTEGSVAAPTAGLHFTDEVIESLHKKRINHSFVTLHVGAGTFKPVTTHTIAEHQMHEEYFEVDKKTIEEINNENKQMVAVGTTSLRTIETLYWLGVQLLKNGINKKGLVHLAQWENLELQSYGQIPKKVALNALLEMMTINNQHRLIGTTGICITPGYKFKITDVLITNFHQPQSTLLLIIAAIVGSSWKNIYTYALNNNFRFLSYGDGCILFIEDQ